MEQLLITKVDFTPYRTISAHVNEAKGLDSYILEAQRLDLIGLIGKRLYFKLIEVYSAYLEHSKTPDYTATAEEQAFIDLLKGKTYQDTEQNTVVYPGLIPVLVYLTYARFVRSAHIQSTAAGFVRKQAEFSEPISSKEISEQAARAESDANAFLTFVFDYIRDNPELNTFYIPAGYSECATDGLLRRTGTRLRSVRSNTITQRIKRS